VIDSYVCIFFEKAFLMVELNQDWEFNVLDIYNYKKPGQYQTLFDYVKSNHDKIAGDIVEAGVFRGRSLVAMGMLLKEIGSNKKIFGFDSFSGFPPIYDPKDDLKAFITLYENEEISKEHWDAVQKNIAWRKLVSKRDVDVTNISSSGDFSETNLELVKRKIDLIGLDNIVLVDGPFSETMRPEASSPKSIMAVLVDCDLYASYQQTLSFVWPRLSSGGVVYLDEYYSLKFPGACAATNEFLRSHSGDLKMAEQIPGDFERWYLVKP
jgi:hypothetical protein